MKKRKAIRSVLVIALLLVAAPAALALPVEVAFSGLIPTLGVQGAAPDGIVDGMSFTGTFSYDPAAADDSNPWFELTGPTALLQLDIGDVSFESDWQTGPFRALLTVVFVDPDDPDIIVDPVVFPDAQPAVFMSATGHIRSAEANDTYLFSMNFFQILTGSIPSYLLDHTLPSPSIALAELMDFGWIEIGNADPRPPPILLFPSACGSGDTGFCIKARITDTSAIPEPSTAALLLVGFATLGAFKRVTRRR
jgi:hypothetical protein